MAEFTRHPTIGCRWCGEKLAKVEGVWWCSTPDCAQRQARQAIWFGVADKRRKLKIPPYWWLPLPVQVEVDEKHARYILFGGAAGGSKSMYGRRGRLWKHALKYPGYQALLLRKSLEELKKTHLSKFPSEVMQLQAAGVQVEYRSSEKHITITHPNGVTSDIFAGYADDLDDLQRLLSTEYDEIFVDEATTLNPALIPELTTRARGSNGPSKDAIKAAGGPWCFFATNPGGPASALISDLFITHTPDWDTFSGKFRTAYDPSQWAYVPAKIEDNPYLDEDYESSLAFLSQDRYEQLRHGNWDVTPGMFFGKFKPTIDGKPHHVREIKVPEGLSWFRAMDWGRVAWGVVGWYVCLPDGHVHLARELKFREMDPSEVAAAIRQVDAELGLAPHQIRYTAADPAMWMATQNVGESIYESMTKAGLYGLTKAKNERVNGWVQVNKWLGVAPDGVPWMTYDPSCTYTIRSLGRVVSDPKNPEDIDDPDDHALDSHRYGVMSRPQPTQFAPPEPVPGTMGAALAEAREAAAMAE